MRALCIEQNPTDDGSYDLPKHVGDLLTSDVYIIWCINPLNPELNPICHLLALLGTHHILHVSRIRVKIWLCKLNLLPDSSVFPNNNFVLSVGFLLGKSIKVLHVPNKCVWNMVTR